MQSQNCLAQNHHRQNHHHQNHHRQNHHHKMAAEVAEVAAPRNHHKVTAEVAEQCMVAYSLNHHTVAHIVAADIADIAVQRDGIFRN